MSQRTKRTLPAAVTALVLVGVALCSTSSAAPSQPARRADAGSVPVLPPADSVRQFTGVAGLASAARIGRAKLNLAIPPLTVAVYVVPEYRVAQRGGTVYARAPRSALPKRPNPACDYYYSGTFADIYAVDIDQPDPPRPGRFRSVGRFPDVRVSMLAFGAIPVSATLHLRQSMKDGRVQPLFLDPQNSRVAVRKGESPLETGGCDPAWTGTIASPFVARGEVEASVSDVRVDGRVVPVGASCRTATPLQLNLTGETPEFGGRYLSADQGGVLTQQLNTSTVNPANPVRLYPGSSNLTVPTFTGCRGGGGDDVSRLVTAMVSGSQNTLAVDQTRAVLGGFDPSAPSLCSEFDGCLSTVPERPRPPAIGR